MNDHFEVVFHHGGKFINDGSLKYVGESNTLTCDPDRWSYIEILSILKEMGYVNIKEMWYSVGGGSVLEGRLELLSDDKWACHMVNIAILNGQVHLFVVHMVSEPQIVHLLAYGGNEVAADEEVDVESSEGSSESDEDFDVHSWNESKEELYVAEGDDGLFDVPIGGDDASEDELF